MREEELKRNIQELEKARTGLQADLQNQVDTSTSLQEALDKEHKHATDL